VDGVIVEDHVNRFSGRHLRLNGIQEVDELLVPMALYTRPMTLPCWKLSRMGLRSSTFLGSSQTE
jgi:hypothetical protein